MDLLGLGQIQSDSVISVGFGQTLDLVGLDQIWSDSVKFGRIRSISIGFCRILITGKFSGIWSDSVVFYLVKFGWIWSDLVGFGLCSFCWEATYFTLKTRGSSHNDGVNMRKTPLF